MYRVIDDGWQPATIVLVVLDCLEARPGPTGEASNPELTPLEMFQLYFTDELFQYIVDQTNLYAE